MRWTLFLFDFDGLLVNTEHLHYQAYLNVFAARSLPLPLSFGNFQELAHLNATAWKEAICAQFPDVEPLWKTIYQEKKEEYLSLLATGKVELMPGVEALLTHLQKGQIRRCVVTHSILPHVQLIRSNLPILATIPHWITREDYEKPKPNPECYLKAIALYGKKGDRIIGFEDSIRGLQALQQTPAHPVLICPSHHPLLEMVAGAAHFESILDFMEEEPLSRGSGAG